MESETIRERFSTTVKRDERWRTKRAERKEGV